MRTLVVAFLALVVGCRARVRRPAARILSCGDIAQDCCPYFFLQTGWYLHRRVAGRGAWVGLRDRERIVDRDLGAARAPTLLPVSDDAYFRLWPRARELQPCATSMFDTALQIGSSEDNGIYLLNPQVVTADGRMGGVAPGVVTFPVPTGFRSFCRAARRRAPPGGADTKTVVGRADGWPQGHPRL